MMRAFGSERFSGKFSVDRGQSREPSKNVSCPSFDTVRTGIQRSRNWVRPPPCLRHAQVDDLHLLSVIETNPTRFEIRQSFRLSNSFAFSANESYDDQAFRDFEIKLSKRGWHP